MAGMTVVTAVIAGCDGSESGPTAAPAYDRKALPPEFEKLTPKQRKGLEKAKITRDS